MTYTIAKQIKTSLEKTVDLHSKRLQKYPKGNLGLTPDNVRALPDYIRDKKGYNIAFKRLQNHNQMFLKMYKKEYLEERKQKRATL